MFKERILRIIVYISLAISLFIAIILAIVALWNYSLLVGWVVGTFVSITGYLINVFTISLSFKKHKSKKRGFWIGFMRSILSLFYYVVWIIIVVIINARFHGNFLFHTNIKDMLSPINIITYIAGISVIMISTFLAHLPIFKEKKNG